MTATVVPESLIAEHGRYDRRVIATVTAAVRRFDPQDLLGAEDGVRSGKRLRPLVAFLASHLGNPDHSQIALAGTTVELLHLASLVHDDVVDRAATRRGRASAHAVLGEPTALLVGTGCFAVASQLAADLGEDAATLVADTGAALARGELLDVERAFDVAVDVEDHLELVQAKTGALFALPAVLGGLCGGLGESDVRHLAAWGRSLGVAFQLIDDWGDLAGSDPGKPRGTDHRNGLYGLATLHALGTAESTALRQALGVGDPDLLDIVAIHDLVCATGGRARVAREVDWALRSAAVQLDALPARSGRDGLDHLQRHLAREWGCVG